MNNTDISTLISRAPVYIEEEKAIWMVTVNAAFLVKLNLRTNQFDEYYEIPYVGRESDRKAVCVSMYKAGDDLIMAPANMEKIVIFHLKTQKFDSVDVPLRANEKGMSMKIGCMCADGKYIYLIGYTLHAIFRVDVEREKCEKVYDSEGEGLFSYQNVAIYADKMYVPMYEESKILIMDLNGHQVEEVSVDTKSEKGFSAMVKQERGFGLITREGTWISYGVNKEEKECFKICEEVIFDAFSDRNGDVWCFELFTDNIWHIDQERTIEKVDFEYPCICDEDKRVYVKYDFKVPTSNGVVFQVRSDGSIYNLDVEEKRINKIDVVPNTDLMKMISRKRLQNGFLPEESKSSLDLFISTVVE